MAFYKTWLYSHESRYPFEEDTGCEVGRREVVLATDDAQEAKAIVRRRSTKGNIQVLVRQDDSCDVLWPREKLPDGEWSHYPDLDTVVVAAEMRGWRVTHEDD